MSAIPNYVIPRADIPEPSPPLLRAFRAYFCQRVTVGGARSDFLTEFQNFRNSYINSCINHALHQYNYPGDSLINPSFSNQIAEDAGRQVDQLLPLVLGMGQISIAFGLLPLPVPDPAQVPCEYEAAPEAAPVALSSKAKPKEARRFTHVLSNMIAKNHKGSGIHGIPEDAKDKVPPPDDILLEMVEAMRDKSAVLDFPDTKPFKDHWQKMKDPDFFGLARTLFYHLNLLHQGVDYVEGFRYYDRYQNLLSLLRSCKGTIYFMSRPSTYEDVLLNPHMMQLRFADNQKNNAKKKVDNRELTARRNQEYVAIHGCDPPPKERAGKGKKRSASVSEMVDDEGEASSPKPKRRRATPKKGKATATTVSVNPTLAPFDNGEGSSVQGQSLETPMGSPAFLGASAHEYGQHYEPEEESEYYFTPEQQIQQQHYNPQQQQPPPAQQHYQQYFNPQQHSPLPQEQQSTSRGQQQTLPIAKARPHHAQTAPTNPNPNLTPTIDLTDDIEQQVATTLSNAVRGVNCTSSSVNTYDSSYHSTDVSPISYHHQRRQTSANYQDVPDAYPVTGIPYNSNVVHEDGKGTQFQNYNSSHGQYNKSRLECQSPTWYSRQQQTQARPRSVKQQPRRQRILHQKPQNQQVHQLSVLNTIDGSMEVVDPCWSGGYQTQPRNISPGEVPQVDETLETDAANRLIEGLLANGPVVVGNQEASAADENFVHQLDILEQLNEKATGDKGDDLYPVDIDNPCFGDLPDIDIDFSDISCLGMIAEPDIYPPIESQNPVTVVHLSNTGGQAAATKLGGENKMKEMDALLALDP